MTDNEIGFSLEEIAETSELTVDMVRYQCKLNNWQSIGKRGNAYLYSLSDMMSLPPMTDAKRKTRERLKKSKSDVLYELEFLRGFVNAVEQTQYSQNKTITELQTTVTALTAQGQGLAAQVHVLQTQQSQILKVIKKMGEWKVKVDNSLKE